MPPGGLVSKPPFDLTDQIVLGVGADRAVRRTDTCRPKRAALRVQVLEVAMLEKPTFRQTLSKPPLPLNMRMLDASEQSLRRVRAGFLNCVAVRRPIGQLARNKDP